MFGMSKLQGILSAVAAVVLLLCLTFGLSYCSGKSAGSTETTAKIQVQETQQIQKEIKSNAIRKQEVQSLPATELDARLDYWMRD